MYGYIIPDKPNMFFKDYALFRAFYCGMCAALKSECGQRSRLTVNYDTAFITALFHSYLEIKPEYKKIKCAPHPFKSRVIAVKNPLIKKLAALNVLTAYYKLTDDINDTKSLKKKLARASLKKAYKKAKKILPEADAVIAVNYNALRVLEKENCASIDRAADCTASMMRDCAKILVGEERGKDEKPPEALGGLFYNLGRYIYLLDALDDIDEDSRKKCYNPFIAAYGDYTNKNEFVAKHRDEIAFAVNSSIAAVNANYDALGLAEGRNLLDNIIKLGLYKKFGQVLNSPVKLKRERF